MPLVAKFEKSHCSTLDAALNIHSSPTHLRAHPVARVPTDVALVSIPRIVNVCIKLAVWYLISRVLQRDENLWIVLFDEGHCLVDVLKLYKGAAVSYKNVSVRSRAKHCGKNNIPLVAEIRTSMDRNSEAMELSKRLS